MAKQNESKINIRDLPAAPGGVTLSGMLKFIAERREARRLGGDWSGIIRRAVEVVYDHELARATREAERES